MNSNRPRPLAGGRLFVHMGSGRSDLSQFGVLAERRGIEGGSQEGPVNRSLIVHYPEKEFFVSCIACASGSAQINGMVRANLITAALPALKAERRDIIREPVHGKYIAVLHVIAIGIMPAEQEFIRSVTVQIQKRKRDFLQQGGGILP